jgi:hypothetical protein
MLRTIAITVALATPALADTAPADMAAQKDKVIALIEANGCKLAPDAAEKVFTDGGFTPETLNPVADAMMAEGTLSFDSSGITLKTGKCK